MQNPVGTDWGIVVRLSVVSRPFVLVGMEDLHLLKIYFWFSGMDLSSKRYKIFVLCVSGMKNIYDGICGNVFFWGGAYTEGMCSF